MKGYVLCKEGRLGRYMFVIRYEVEAYVHHNKNCVKTYCLVPIQPQNTYMSRVQSAHETNLLRQN